MNAARTRVGRAFAGAAFALMLALGATAPPARAALATPERALLTHFLDALRARDYATAFAFLTKAERAYFGTAANYASAYATDRVKVDGYRIIGSKVRGDVTVAIVQENVAFYAYKVQRSASLTAKIPYGIVSEHGTLGIKDPYHPWFAFAPPDWKATQNGVTVVVRKVSFFTGQVEFVLSFENRSTAIVTVLPYGKSVVRDDADAVHQPVETKIASLTDPALYTGARLAPGAEYTGTMTFFTANRFVPKTLSATIAPFLADGADAPFAIDLPALAVPRP